MKEKNDKILSLKEVIMDINFLLNDLSKKNLIDLNILRGIKKTINILENNSSNGFKNISKYLSDDMRIIYDNRINNELLYSKIDYAYQLATKINEDK